MASQMCLDYVLLQITLNNKKKTIILRILFTWFFLCWLKIMHFIDMQKVNNTCVVPLKWMASRYKILKIAGFVRLFSL